MEVIYICTIITFVETVEEMAYCRTSDVIVFNIFWILSSLDWKEASVILSGWCYNSLIFFANFDIQKTTYLVVVPEPPL